MARIRETSKAWTAAGIYDDSGVWINEGRWFGFFCAGVCGSDEITVKQARRLAKWINARCDEIERKSDGK